MRNLQPRISLLQQSNHAQTKPCRPQGIRMFGMGLYYQIFYFGVLIFWFQRTYLSRTMEWSLTQHATKIIHLQWVMFAIIVFRSESWRKIPHYLILMCVSFVCRCARKNSSAKSNWSVMPPSIPVSWCIKTPTILSSGYEYQYMNNLIWKWFFLFSSSLTGVKPYKCTSCSKCFNRRSTLTVIRQLRLPLNTLCQLIPWYLH